MNVAIRVDASAELGTGHMVRCMTLADALAVRGASVTFLFARMPQHLQDDAMRAGHALIALPCDAWALPDESGWSETAQAADAHAILADIGEAQWVICDHYGLNRCWERHMRLAGHRVLAIDDLGRTHDCDILLDQNFYADPGARYPAGSAKTMLIGPHYALLKPAFAIARQRVAPRDGAVQRLHLCMGGSDPTNATATMLDAIEQAGLQSIALDVIIGALHPARDDIARRCAANARWTLHVQTDAMADLLAEADLAIGASGTATWERCALGVPTLAVAVAENQAMLLDEVSRAGIVYGVPADFDAARIARHLAALEDNPVLRERISTQALAVTDGDGAARVAALIVRATVAVRVATLAESARLHAWRNAPQVRAVSRQSDVIAIEGHNRWLQQTLESTDRWLLIGSRDGVDIGVVRFDMTDTSTAEVSIYTTPDAAPGDGTPLLLAAEAWLRNHIDAAEMICAVVLAGNARSASLFARAGYSAASHAYEKKVRP